MVQFLRGLRWNQKLMKSKFNAKDAPSRSAKKFIRFTPIIIIFESRKLEGEPAKKKWR